MAATRAPVPVSCDVAFAILIVKTLALLARGALLPNAAPAA